MENMDMKRTSSYFDDFSRMNPSAAASSNLYGNPQTSKPESEIKPIYYGGYKPESSNAYGHPTGGQNDPVKLEGGPSTAADPKYGPTGGHPGGHPTGHPGGYHMPPQQALQMGGAKLEDADGEYEFDLTTAAVSRSQYEGGLSAGDYHEGASNDTARVRNKNGKDVRMVLINHSNPAIPVAQSTTSSNSNGFGPSTPTVDHSNYGYDVSHMNASIHSNSPSSGFRSGTVVSETTSPDNNDTSHGTTSNNNGNSSSNNNNINNSNSNSNVNDSNNSNSGSGSGSGSGTGSVLNNNGGGVSPEPMRKKQKRNKPTLSCSECVERKTKCDRGRPHCLSCIKRQTECKYAHVANLLEETNRTAASSGGRRVTRPLMSKKVPGSSAVLSIPNIADRGILSAHSESLGSVALSTGLLSNVPYSLPTASNVFGIGSEHPFANYWTCEGGLSEVISVLPDKIQSDILLMRYFECFDPVYPMIHQQYFYADFEHFWSMNPDEKNCVDPAFVGLLFAMLALGTQFVSATSISERKQTAEFYASASNQALRLSSYLSSASIRSIQAMVLITYFLINDNHASDGWAFAGILMRQSYAMGLHRDPNIVAPNATPFEKQQRRKLWQAVLLQDTFFTVLLSLPPTATHTDVNVEDFEEDEATDPNNKNVVTDTAYVRGSWTLANLVQEVISSPRSLDVPICTTTRHKSKLVADFRAIYRSFPDIFRSWDPESLTQLARTNKRVVRQTLFLSSNYFHNLMLVHASESADVPVNVRGTLEAAHDAITSFFVLFKLFEDEAGVWWVFNHRAFLEALCIGGVLKETVYKNGGPEAAAKDPVYTRARADIEKMVQVMRIMGEGENGSEVARIRVKVLSEFL